VRDLKTVRHNRICWTALTLGLLVLSCHAPRRQAASTRPTIRAEQAAVGGLSFKSTGSDVVAALGRPVRVAKVDDETGVFGEFTIYSYPDIEIQFAQGAVIGLRCSDSRYETADGVAIGDPEEEVFRIYGHTDIQDRDGERWVSYQVEGTDEYLAFTFRGQRVHRIELWFPTV
jgi:hypothetical protein